MSDPKANTTGFLNNRKVRGAGALLLLLGALGYGLGIYHKYTGGLPPKPFKPLPPPTTATSSAAPAGLPDMRAIMPSDEERRTMMNDMMGRISATDAQRKKIEDIWITGFKNPASLFQRIQESQSVLTPQQIQTIRPLFLMQVFSRVGQMRKMMKPEDFAILNQRLQSVLLAPPGGAPGASARK